jgi:hypothetical protein
MSYRKSKNFLHVDVRLHILNLLEDRLDVQQIWINFGWFQVLLTNDENLSRLLKLRIKTFIL